MKLLSFLLIIAALFYSVSAQKDAKAQRLQKLAASNNGIVKLNSNTYTQYTEGKRSYGIVVLMTALSDYINCGPCR